MNAMRRLQIQIDEATYAALRLRAYERRCSMSAAVREVLVESLAPKPRSEDGPHDWLAGIVGIGASSQPPDRPVSEHHDEALVKAFSERWSGARDDAD